jgi:DNA-binding CsgD family transcriptional regulator
MSIHAQRVLAVASVIGTQFSFVLLRRLVEDIAEEDVLAAFDEALAARIIEELNTRGCYEFDHVLTRDTLYERIPSLERALLHQRIGAELEQEHQHNPAPYLALLAYHFHAALHSGSVAKALAYAMQAAEQARARLAYEDAERCIGMALSALDQTSPVDLGLRCRLVIARGDAQMKAGRAVEALETLTEAASRARHLGAAEDLAEAAIDFEEITWRLGLPGARAVRLLEQSIAQLTADDDAARARLQSCLVRALAFSGSTERARQLHDETVSLARRAGDPTALEAALRSVFWLQSDPADLEELLGVSEETVQLARQLGSKERELDAAAFRLNLLIAVGDYAGFTRDLEDFVQIAGALRQPFHEYHGTAMRAAEALFVGRFAEAEQLARRAATLGARLPGLDASGAFGMQMFALAQERGQLPQLAPLVRQFAQLTPKSVTWRPALVLALAELDQVDQAIAELEQLATQQFQGVERDSLWPACLAYMAEACALAKDLKHAGELYALLLPWQGRNLVAASMVMCYGPADRLLGMLCTILERWDSAARHFDAAIAMNERQGSRPWLAHTQYEYAVMLAERKQPGYRERAGALLASALEIAEALDMAKIRDAASRLKLELDERPRTPSFPGGLSRREAEVLRMVASGKSNQEIAAAIFRSPNTVAKHVSSILGKLGAANRTEAATFAARHGLL